MCNGNCRQGRHCNCGEPTNAELALLYGVVAIAALSIGTGIGKLTWTLAVWAFP